MSTDDKQTYAIIFLSVVTLVQHWFVWRMANGCRLLAYNHANLVELVARLERAKKP
jgi:hypothetical protein